MSRLIVLAVLSAGVLAGCYGSTEPAYVDRVLSYAGRITCLQVSGRTAVVGSIGRTAFSGSYPDPDATPDARALVTIVDGGPGAKDRADAVDFFPSTAPPPDCAAPHPPSDNEADAEAVNVYDAP